LRRAEDEMDAGPAEPSKAAPPSDDAVHRDFRLWIRSDSAAVDCECDAKNLTTPSTEAGDDPTSGDDMDALEMFSDDEQIELPPGSPLAQLVRCRARRGARKPKQEMSEQDKAARTIQKKFRAQQSAKKNLPTAVQRAQEQMQAKFDSMDEVVAIDPTIAARLEVARKKQVVGVGGKLGAEKVDLTMRERKTLSLQREYHQRRAAAEPAPQPASKPAPAPRFRAVSGPAAPEKRKPAIRVGAAHEKGYVKETNALQDLTSATAKLFKGGIRSGKDKLMGLRSDSFGSDIFENDW